MHLVSVLQLPGHKPPVALTGKHALVNKCKTHLKQNHRINIFVSFTFNRNIYQKERTLGRSSESPWPSFPTKHNQVWYFKEVHQKDHSCVVLSNWA